MVSVNKVESFLCLVIWMFSILYSVFNFALASKEIKSFLDPSDFREGWLISQYQDISDFEWLVLKNLFKDHLTLILGYIILSQLIWCFSQKYITIFWIIYGSISIAFVLSPLSLFIIWSNIIIAILLHLTNKTFTSYILFIFLIFSIHKDSLFNLKKYLFGENYYKIFLFEVSIAWLNAKCLSFSIDRITHTYSKIQYLPWLHIFAYCLYFPAFYTGPIYNYNDFVINLTQRPLWKFSCLSKASIRIFRYLFWALFLEFAQHLIYSSSIQFFPQLCERLDSWTLAGLGYALPCLFHIKYLVIYGISGSLAEMDGIYLPPPPRCVTRMNLSSSLWKHFDRGLHLWLIKYIYKPLIGPKESLIRIIYATGVSFACVCLWHGMDQSIICWCFLNFLCVSFEVVGRYMARREICYKAKWSNLMKRRIASFIGSPFFLLMILSNVFFLSNYELGSCLVKRFLFKFPFPLIPTLLIMQAACYVSIQWKNVEKNGSSMAPKYF